jgi:hypothetical protein
VRLGKVLNDQREEHQATSPKAINETKKIVAGTKSKKQQSIKFPEFQYTEREKKNPVAAGPSS